MKLADLRKLAIRQQVKIRFRLSGGMECVVTERGIAQVPQLGGVPDFNLEEELASAVEFSLEPAGAAPKNPAGPNRVSRDELAAMAGSATAAAAHEDE